MLNVGPLLSCPLVLTLFFSIHTSLFSYPLNTLLFFSKRCFNLFLFSYYNPLLVYKRGREKNDWPLQRQKAWGNHIRTASPLSKNLRLSTAPCGKVRPPVYIQRKTLLSVVILTGEEELFCVSRGKHRIKMFCCWAPLKEMPIASPTTARMWVMRTPFGMFFCLATASQDKFNSKRSNL